MSGIVQIIRRPQGFNSYFYAHAPSPAVVAFGRAASLSPASELAEPPCGLARRARLLRDTPLETLPRPLAVAAKHARADTPLRHLRHRHPRTHQATEQPYVGRRRMASLLTSPPPRRRRPASRSRAPCLGETPPGTAASCGHPCPGRRDSLARRTGRPPPAAGHSP